MADVNINQEKSDAIVVTGLGMISSIGRDVVTSCASARAGITRISELAYFSVFDKDSDDLFPEAPVAAHVITGFSEGFVGSGRLIRLGAAALADLLAYAQVKDSGWSKTGFFLNLPNGYYVDVTESIHKEENEFRVPQEVGKSERTEVMEEKYRTRVIPTLLTLNRISIPQENQAVYFADHHGIIAAIQRARALLKEGILERCVIGGIESYLESDMLEVLADLGMLKIPENPNGFFPGEVAAFFMIERYDKAYLRGAKIEAILEAAAITKESCHRFSEDPSVGAALSEAIEITLDQLQDRANEIGLIISDANGDHWRATEWGNAMVRVLARHPSLDQPQWYPALSFGETGAATGAIAVCMGVRGFVRGCAKTQRILISTSSHDGNKGSVSLHDVSQIHSNS